MEWWKHFCSTWGCLSIRIAQRILYKNFLHSNWTNTHGDRAPIPPLLSKSSICASVCVSPRLPVGFSSSLVGYLSSLLDFSSLFCGLLLSSLCVSHHLCGFLLVLLRFSSLFYLSLTVSPLCGLGSTDLLSSQCFALWSFWSTKNIQDYFRQGIFL